ncbi:MAG: anti-sigma factor, partial [Myxococcota bacterium]
MNKATWTTKVHWGSRALTVVAMGALLVACSDDGDSDAGDGDASMRTLSMSYQGLPALGDGFVYEGWLIVDGAPVSTGRFTVDAAGALSPSTFELDAAVADAGTTFILTIEPAVGDDPAPADTHVLAGDMSNGESVLTIDHTAALG